MTTARQGGDLLVRHAQSLSTGDLTVRTEEPLPAEFQILATAMNQTGDSLSRVVSVAAQTSEQDIVRIPLPAGRSFPIQSPVPVTRVSVRTSAGRPIAEFTGYSRTLGGAVVEI